MSEYAQDEGSPSRQGSDVNLLNSLDDSANNSIIGKVKSRVSSILPNRLSKWFSPSTKLQNESFNGSLRGEFSTQPSRRRRRIEVEEEESYEDGDYCGVNSNPNSSAKQERDVDVDDENENDEDDDSQYSEYEYNCSSIKQTRRNLNVERQPPAKRSRLNVEVRDSPCITRHQPLLSSTPDIVVARLRNSPKSRYNYQRHTHLNLYGNQHKKEPAFIFVQQRDNRSGANINTEIIDLITNTGYERDNHTESSDIYGCRNTGISSRRSLNIPSTTPSLHGSESLNVSVGPLKRPPMTTTKADFASINAVNVPPRRTSTTIQEVEEQINDLQEKTLYKDIDKQNVTSNQNSYAYNGCNDVSNSFSNKRQKLINGTSLSAIVIPESNEVISIDSASESGESAVDVIKLNSSHAQHGKAGLFNMSASGSTRNNSRTSSFGNGLNFNSHLEGRKSLFSGSNHVKSYPINNSTLSLTSLNRRQFNASIYGSTSALSDSRLLNTFSPFYKGKTTYGGAAAYNKYTAGAVRIKPTLIRPTSSLSNLSSCNSLPSNVNSQVGDNSAISSTAKRILDLINDFTTPLSDAKKMASNLKTNSISQIPLQAKTRLNENDLNESRSIRLSQVQKPYSRSAFILQPSGNASGRGTACGLLPPVKELQVPTMSQLLQMKKMQSTTEKVRKITQNSGLNTEYTLPEVEISKTNSKVSETDQQKHTNKIRNKITKTFRAAAAKDLQEEPPPPVNLPNIAFPLMQSVPKIDIQLKKTSEPYKIYSELQSSKITLTAEISNTALKDSSKPATLDLNFSQKKSSTELPVSTVDNKKQPFVSTLLNSTTKTFEFSEPLQITGDVRPCQNVTQNEKDKYKFSPPLDITFNCLEVKKTQAKNPNLNDGSCLDVLKKPFTLPSVTPECSLTVKKSLNTTSLASSYSFGNQFKKSSNEWECDACMLRNKSEASKCVACETPMKQKTLKSESAINSSIPITTPFGQQFKKSSNEWECEACMVRNKEDTTKCIACETPRKCIPPVIAAIPHINNSFGDAFKPKSDTWECQTCMISNKNEVDECVACQTKKPGSTNTSQCAIFSSQFKFGFEDVNKAKNRADADFKALAAQQKVSKWECDACMTRNDANRTKCACCEQPKPGVSNAESATTSSTKFEFGATAASKFSFGFGTGPNASKEEDIRKELSSKTEEIPKPTSTNFVTSQLPPANGGFQFGIKPTISSADETKNDVTDSNKHVAGFQFGVSSSVGLKVSEKTAVSTPAGLESGSKLLTTTVSPISLSNPIKSSTANTPSVKFSLPSTTTSTTNVANKDLKKNVTLPAFGFGSNSASSTTVGFSFGSKMEANSTAAKETEKSSSDGTVFKEPAAKSLAFAFGSSAANTSTVSSACFVSSFVNTTATTTPTSIKTCTTPVVKPMFSFGTNTSNVSANNSQSSPPLGSFVFGSNATNNVAVKTTASSLFGAVTSTVTSTTNATTTSTSLSTLSTATTTPASTNIFVSFGGGGSCNTSTPPIFGSSANSPANNNLSSVSSSTNNTTTSNTPQFGTFEAKNISNVFGSFGGIGNVETKNTALENQKETKCTASPFGNVAPNSISQPSQSDVSGFVFGSKSLNNATVVTTTSSTGSVTSTSTTWPKNSFVFGSNVTSPTITSEQSNENENKDVAKTSLFGSFGPSSTNSSSQQKTSSIFGVPTSNIGASLSSSGTSSTGPTSFGTNLFNTNSAPAATNIFGANPSGNAATPTPAFGSSPFGGSTSLTSATPTFGSTAASGTSFGSFGGSTSSTTKKNTEVKKPEAAFNFGAAPAVQNTSGGFNFGLSSSTTKPAFNFGGASTNQQPTFNFTGSAETQSSAKPFQFGAIPSAPVFNFNRSVLEGTPNAPFQFNAGAAPVSNNIFAPTPTAGTQTAQQAKRKIRAPIRRVTQR